MSTYTESFGSKRRTRQLLPTTQELLKVLQVRESLWQSKYIEMLRKRGNDVSLEEVRPELEKMYDEKAEELLQEYDEYRPLFEYVSSFIKDENATLPLPNLEDPSILPRK